MPTRAVVLLSGGLDSRLAVRILQEQDIEVEALNFRTLFTCCQDTAAQAARDLNVRLTVVGQEDNYLQLIKRPRFGYGKGANPCVDCRIYMFRLAKKFMEDVGACVVASGEVLGQRPKSQKRRDLQIIAQDSGLNDHLLRPLSAKLLPPTAPERESLIDRERLYGFRGRGRRGLIQLARSFGFGDREIPSPSTGCTLTEPLFAGKVHDLVRWIPQGDRDDFELLKTGRHFRFDDTRKVVVGRRESENASLGRWFDSTDSSEAALLTPSNFAGPTALVCGPVEDDVLRFAGGLIVRYARQPGETPEVSVRRTDRPEATVEIAADAVAETADSL